MRQLTLEKSRDDKKKFEEKFLDNLLHFANDKYLENDKTPLKILDLARFPAYFNVDIIKQLLIHHIDYQILITDISQYDLREKYNYLKFNISSSKLNKITFAIADGNDIRREFPTLVIKQKPHQDIGEKPFEIRQNIEQIVNSEKYSFLKPGHNEQGIRTEKFKDNSFDIVLMKVPQESLCSYNNFINETIRVAKPGAYCVFDITQSESYFEQKNKATRYIDIVHEALNKLNPKFAEDCIKKELTREYFSSEFRPVDYKTSRTIDPNKRTIIFYQKQIKS